MQQAQDKLEFPIEVISDSELHERFAKLEREADEDLVGLLGVDVERPMQDVVKTIPSQDEMISTASDFISDNRSTSCKFI